MSALRLKADTMGLKLLFLLLGIAVFQGCHGGGKVMRIETFPPQVMFGSVNNGGRSTKEIDSGEPLVDLIKKWCESNPTGWTRSFNTFAPVFEYRGTNFSVNVRSDFVVANLKKPDGQWEQLIKSTPQSLWNEINTLAAIASKETK